MTDIDESETASKAKLFWSKSRDAKYLTQPKDLTKTTSLSNLDKNYEELTQKRGATEGAISSKVRRWEDWKTNFQKKDTEDSVIQDLPDSKSKRSLVMVDIRPNEAHSNKIDDEIAPDQDAKKKPAHVPATTNSLAKSLEIEIPKKQKQNSSILKKNNPALPRNKSQIEEENSTDDKINSKSPKERRILHSSSSSPSLSFPKGKEDMNAKPDDEAKSRAESTSSPSKRRKIREVPGDRALKTTHSLTPIKSEKIKKKDKESDGIEMGEKLVKAKSLGVRGNAKDSKEEEKSKERRKRLDEFKQKLKKQRTKSKDQG